MYERWDFPEREGALRNLPAAAPREEAYPDWERTPPFTVRIVAPRLLCRALSSALLHCPAINLVDGPADILVLAGSDWQERLCGTEPGDGRAARPGLLLVCDRRTDFAVATRASIRAFVGEDEDLPELLAGLRAALRREAFCSAGALAFLPQAFRSIPSAPGLEPPCPGIDRLSHRELEVARKVAEGLTNQQVAHLLHVSEPTVKFHLQHVFRKLGISGRSRLAYMLTTLPPPFSPQQPDGCASVSPLRDGTGQVSLRGFASKQISGSSSSDLHSPPPNRNLEPLSGACRLLTIRERAVAGRVAQGLSNKQVAQVLHIALPTVKFHLRQVYRKLGVNRRSHLVCLLARLSFEGYTAERSY